MIFGTKTNRYVGITSILNDLGMIHNSDFMRTLYFSILCKALIQTV